MNGVGNKVYAEKKAADEDHEALDQKGNRPVLYGWLSLIWVGRSFLAGVNY